MKKSLINKCLAEAKKYLADDPCHGLEHVNNLIKIADHLIAKEKIGNKIDKEMIYLAIIFHDFGRINNLTKKNRDNHDFYSAQLAKSFLKKNNYARAEEVARIIDKHDSKGKTMTIEEKIFYDSDIVDAIGAVGIGRTFTYGGQIKRDLKGSMKRLLWKSFRDQPSTKSAKKLVIQRRQFIKKFIQQYNQEINIK